MKKNKKIEYAKTITKPITITFRGKDGKLIKFNATKCIKKPTKIDFHKINKKVSASAIRKKTYKRNKFKCEYCGEILIPSQRRIEKEIYERDSEMCYCDIIKEIDRLNKKIRKLKNKLKEVKNGRR